MTDPFFAAGQTTWAPMISPGFSWAAPTLAAGNLGTANLPPIPPPPGRLPVDAANGTFNGFGGYSALPAVTIPVVTASSVVAALAMRRGQPAGPTSDADIEDFLFDALDLFPGTSEAEVRCDGGRVTLSGSVPNKRQKHDVGEIAWAIPSVNDVQNSMTIATRRRARGASRDTEAQPSGHARKQG